MILNLLTGTFKWAVYKWRVAVHSGGEELKCSRLMQVLKHSAVIHSFCFPFDYTTGSNVLPLETFSAYAVFSIVIIPI